jgi:hypothetical protein
MQPAASVHREQIAAAERSEFLKRDQVSAVYFQNENPQIPVTAIKMYLRKQKVELLPLSRVDLCNQALYDTEMQGRMRWWWWWEGSCKILEEAVQKEWEGEIQCAEGVLVDDFASHDYVIITTIV